MSQVFFNSNLIYMFYDLFSILELSLKEQPSGQPLYKFSCVLRPKTGTWTKYFLTATKITFMFCFSIIIERAPQWSTSRLYCVLLDMYIVNIAGVYMLQECPRKPIFTEDYIFKLKWEFDVILLDIKQAVGSNPGVVCVSTRYKPLHHDWHISQLKNILLPIPIAVHSHKK